MMHLRYGSIIFYFAWLHTKYSVENIHMYIHIEFEFIFLYSKVRLQLWDTAGQERFRRSMVAHYYRNVAAVVLVYDVTRQSTFEALSHWIEVSTYLI